MVKVIALWRLVIGDPKTSVLSAARPYEPITVSPSDGSRGGGSGCSRKYNLLAVPVVAEDGHVLGIVTVDDVIDAIISESTEDIQKFGGMEALDEPYLKINFLTMIRKRAGWLCVLFLSEMLTASAMQHYQAASSRQLSSPKPASTSATRASIASGASGPSASSMITAPGPAASIISPMIDVPPTLWPSRIDAHGGIEGSRRT